MSNTRKYISNGPKGYEPKLGARKPCFGDKDLLWWLWVRRQTRRWTATSGSTRRTKPERARRARSIDLEKGSSSPRVYRHPEQPGATVEVGAVGGLWQGRAAGHKEGASVAHQEGSGFLDNLMLRNILRGTPQKCSSTFFRTGKGMFWKKGGGAADGMDSNPFGRVELHV